MRNIAEVKHRALGVVGADKGKLVGSASRTDCYSVVWHICSAHQKERVLGGEVLQCGRQRAGILFRSCSIASRRSVDVLG